MKHTLSYNEILNIPAGRIMNTFIQEYVFKEQSTRWNGHEEENEVQCRWFEEHPRQCAEDDGGYCTADSLMDYSRDATRALALVQAPALKTMTLKTHVTPTTTDFPAMEKRYWATFSEKPFEVDQKHAECNRKWASAETFALAVCRAALLNTSWLCG